MGKTLDLPENFKPFFWDHEFEKISWENHQNFIIQRLLQSGNWSAVSWLREQLGDFALSQWIKDHQGGGLSPRQLRFWELILDIEHQRLNQWIETAKNNPWEKRVRR